jgi:SET domain-containing protein
VWFVAKRDIEPGDEICFDYGDDYWLEGDDVVV